MFEAWYGSMVAVLVLTLAFIRRIKYEEALLIAELGQQYRHFLSNRAKLLPLLY
jgi:protein-S-isoprenylcysteine O-methyltransferase Ste14